MIIRAITTILHNGRHYWPGDVLPDVDDGLGQTLCEQGIAELVNSSLRDGEVGEGADGAQASSAADAAALPESQGESLPDKAGADSDETDGQEGFPTDHDETESGEATAAAGLAIQVHDIADLEALDGISETTVRNLVKAGYDTLEKVRTASARELSEVKTIGLAKARLILDAVKAGWR